MDPKVQFIDDVKPLQDTELLPRPRHRRACEWAVPLYKGLLKARLDNGNFQTCNVLGLDDATLIGGPPKMVAGPGSPTCGGRSRSSSTRVGAEDKLAKTARRRPPSPAKTRPLDVGDTMELNDHRAVVVGICEVSRTFQSQPVVYTTYTRATTLRPAGAASCSASCWSRPSPASTSTSCASGSPHAPGWRPTRKAEF